MILLLISSHFYSSHSRQLIEFNKRLRVVAHGLSSAGIFSEHIIKIGWVLSGHVRKKGYEVNSLFAIYMHFLPKSKFRGKMRFFAYRSYARWRSGIVVNFFAHLTFFDSTPLLTDFVLPFYLCHAKTTLLTFLTSISYISCTKLKMGTHPQYMQFLQSKLQNKWKQIKLLCMCTNII